MKTSQKLRALLLASFLTGGSTYAAEPQPAPDVQALITLLNRLVAEAGLEADGPASTSSPAPVPAKPQGGLRMSSLATSGSLSGGSLGLSSRLSNEDWRALFTSRSTTK
jgi:hypothetical protein